MSLMSGGMDEIVSTAEAAAEARGFARGIEAAMAFLDKRRAYWEGMAERSQRYLSHESAREARELANELGLARVALQALAKGETMIDRRYSPARQILEKALRS